MIRKRRVGAWRTELAVFAHRVPRMARPIRLARRLAALALLVILLGPVSDPEALLDPARCAGRMALTPQIDPGPIWQRHRFQLLGDIGFDGQSEYLIVNARTGEIRSDRDWFFRAYYAGHGWSFRANHSGRASFFIHTTHALLHPGWDRDPWYLEYGCS